MLMLRLDISFKQSEVLPELSPDVGCLDCSYNRFKNCQIYRPSNN